MISLQNHCWEGMLIYHRQRGLANYAFYLVGKSFLSYQTAYLQIGNKLNEFKRIAFSVVCYNLLIYRLWFLFVWVLNISRVFIQSYRDMKWWYRELELIFWRSNRWYLVLISIVHENRCETPHSANFSTMCILIFDFFLKDNYDLDLWSCLACL